MSQESERLSAGLNLSDRLIEEASKRDIAAVARVLALLVATARRSRECFAAGFIVDDARAQFG